MQHFLAIHAGYHLFQIGIFSYDPQTITVIKTFSGDKRYASQRLAPAIKDLLASVKISIQDLDFIAADCGPGPFTSLRVAVTTANGLGFALACPLIGVNSLQALLEQEYDPAWPTTVALYNAYNNDFYYGFRNLDTSYEIGVNNKEKLLLMLHNKFPHQQIRFIGDGVSLLHDRICATFSNSYIPHPLPAEPSIQAIGILAHALFISGKHQKQLQPIYLKTGYNL
jgi:tRNA threonylcarbamoyladenosine biosynthesis protein TsaB